MPSAETSKLFPTLVSLTFPDTSEEDGDDASLFSSPAPEHRRHVSVDVTQTHRAKARSQLQGNSNVDTDNNYGSKQPLGAGRVSGTVPRVTLFVSDHSTWGKYHCDLHLTGDLRLGEAVGPAQGPSVAKGWSQDPNSHL